MSKPKTAERGAQVRFPPPLVFVGFILFGIALQYAVGPIPFPIDRWISLTAGILVSLIGLSLIGSTLSPLRAEEFAWNFNFVGHRCEKATVTVNRMMNSGHTLLR